jgi:AGCS family alanine or glycine:cation symporter
MERFTHWLEVISNYVWSYPVVILCLSTGLFFTLYKTFFVQVRSFRHAITLITGHYDNPSEHGQITHFQALSTALSGTMGLGNIAGVSIAIELGGPGTIFWMWVVGFFGMATKFVECTLGTHYRDEDEETGEVRGGPMYYIQKGMGDRWRWLAVFFAVCVLLGSFGGGGMFQSNQAAAALHDYFHIPPYVSGIVLAILVGVVILGGITRIGKVASKIVPAMCLI